MATAEELQGIMAGLASIVKDLTQNINHIRQQVGQLARPQQAPQAPPPANFCTLFDPNSSASNIPLSWINSRWCQWFPWTFWTQNLVSFCRINHHAPWATMCGRMASFNALYGKNHRWLHREILNRAACYFDWTSQVWIWRTNSTQKLLARCGILPNYILI